MAILTAPKSSGSVFGDLGPQAPEGTFLATCIEVKDQFQVTRRKFQSEETEVVDLTQFLFGFRDRAGNPYKVATMPMKQSGHEKSALYKFLRQWLGKAPKMGWDYCEMKGQKGLLTVEHKPNRDNTDVFANIVSITPVPEGYGQQAAGAAQPPVAKKPAAPPPPPPAAEDLPLADDDFTFDPATDVVPF